MCWYCAVQLQEGRVKCATTWCGVSVYQAGMTTRQVKFLNRAVGGRTALRRGIAVRLRNPGIAAAIEDDGPGAIDGVRHCRAACVRAGVSIQHVPSQGKTA